MPHFRHKQRIMPDTPKKSSSPGFVARLRGWLFTGIAVVAPAVITFYIIVWLIGVADNLYTASTPAAYDVRRFLPFPVPGIGVIWGLLLLIIIGALARTLFLRPFIAAGERLVGRMPVVSGIYGSLRQVFQMIFSSESALTGEIGLIEYPRKGIYAIAFVTATSKGEIQMRTEDEVVGVFVPTTPNPTSGFFLYVPRKDIIFMDMGVEDAAKLIVTAGLVEPEYKGKTITQPERK